MKRLEEAPGFRRNHSPSARKRMVQTLRLDFRCKRHSACGSRPGGRGPSAREVHARHLLRIRFISHRSRT